MNKLFFITLLGFNYGFSQPVQFFRFSFASNNYALDSITEGKVLNNFDSSYSAIKKNSLTFSKISIYLDDSVDVKSENKKLNAKRYNYLKKLLVSKRGIKGKKITLNKRYRDKKYDYWVYGWTIIPVAGHKIE
ncbi:MAG: hypothetical protein ABIP51_04945 [Bacteroidia bacterium]